MPGPALTPIANPLPVAPAKGPEGSRPDAASPGREADAPDTGFAGELQRRMQGEAGSQADTAADTGNTRSTEESATPAATEPGAPPPELAALLAGRVKPIADTAPEAPKRAADSTTDPGLTALNAGLNLAGTAAVPAAGGKPDGGRTALTAELTADAGRAANLADPAADVAGKPASPAAPETTGSQQEHLLERAPDTPAVPTNSFAAIHAAALANLRGEPTQAAPAPLPIHVATPADSPTWPEEVGNRVSWMVGQHESQAELTLTPPQLGKIEVSITVSDEQTSAQFVTATPAARELIEQSLPRLREILEQSGISLGQTDVGTSGQRGDGSGNAPRGRTGGGSDSNAAPLGAPSWLRRGEGLVDTFA